MGFLGIPLGQFLNNIKDPMTKILNILNLFRIFWFWKILLRSGLAILILICFVLFLNFSRADEVTNRQTEKEPIKKRILELPEGLFFTYADSLVMIPDEENKIEFLYDRPFEICFRPKEKIISLSVYASEKEYELKDPDQDGIYSATLVASRAYKDKKLPLILKEEYQRGKMKLSNFFISVLPYGYIYETLGKEDVQIDLGKGVERFIGKELRIKDASVILYRKNPETSEWLKWPAEEFNQKNPQRTDKDGEYIFVVSPGDYYVKVIKQGYNMMKSRKFEIERTMPVNVKIKISSPFIGFQRIQTLLHFLGIETELSDSQLIPIFILIVNFILGAPLIVWGAWRVKKRRKLAALKA